MTGICTGERHLVECFINKIKHYRRIFSRFEKLDTRYLGFLHFTRRSHLATVKCQQNLESAFETWWPQLESMLGEIPEATEEAPPSPARSGYFGRNP